ncbi:MAG: hypothetical protein CM1200mP24_09010 [Gammaproteobacteria bacterium]|nr:MAG: hypothetical protein CM1200mP24_09010 [Gammaproteobacteria bacterium]
MAGSVISRYKKNRHPMPGDLRSQLGRIISRFGSLNVRTVLVDGFEADDVIASVARQVVAAGSTPPFCRRQEFLPVDIGLCTCLRPLCVATA